MKANLPISHIQGAKGERMRSMKMFFIYAGYILYRDFGFGEKRLKQFAAAVAEFSAVEKKNDTIGDEAIAWAKKYGFMDKE